MAIFQSDGQAKVGRCHSYHYRTNARSPLEQSQINPIEMDSDECEEFRFVRVRVCLFGAVRSSICLFRLCDVCSVSVWRALHKHIRAKSRAIRADAISDAWNLFCEMVTRHA